MSWLALEGKTAVVTGGASGIGKAVVFLDNGANVVVCDMNPQEPEYTLNENSGEVLYVQTDVTKADSVNAMVKAAKEKFGKIDVLVNNAGINIPRFYSLIKKTLMENMNLMKKYLIKFPL